MIKLRLASFGDNLGDRQIEIVEGESLKSAALRCLHDIKLEKDIDELFHILVNGHFVSSEFWDDAKLSATDTVLIAPKLGDGESGQIAKTIIIIGATLAANYFIPGSGTFTHSLLVAGVNIATSVALNSAFPPPTPGVSPIKEVQESQAYSITSQSNAVNKLGFVPKVYGTHRMFPLIAANPYIELEASEQSGDMIQWFHAIYDFGLGPCDISDIKIGDTPIEEFSDVEFNLVDLNKPLVSEGAWDDALVSEFTLYKGDQTPEAVSYALNENQVDGGDEDEYSAIRNSAVNADGVSQEIILTFICPAGLYSISSDGKSGTRSIDLDIHYAKVGTEDWKAFNDLDFVSNFKSVGGDPIYQDVPVTLLPVNLGTPSGSLTPEYSILKVGELIPSPLNTTYYKTSWAGYPAGATYIVFQTGQAAVGNSLSFAGSVIGKVASITSSPYAGYSRYYLETPLKNSIIVASATASCNSAGVCGLMNWGTPPLNKKIFKKMPYLNKVRLTANTTSPFYSTVRFTPKNPGQYKVRVVRVKTSSPYSTRVSDDLTWAEINTKFDRAPIKTTKRHVFLELKIRATNQLNGSIRNLSGVVSSALLRYNGSTWVREITSNPAWVFCDILTGQVNKRPIELTRLHTPSLLEWEAFCDQIPTPPSGYDYVYPRFRTDFVLDYQTTVGEAIAQVSGAAAASLNLIDGKYGVLIDKEKTVPVQVFTPRNSWGFTASRQYGVTPHAVRVKYIDPAVDWEVAEAIVYDTGYDADNAENIDEVTSFACTQYEQAWRFGRYLLFQHKLRRETIVINVDFEHLVCTRGDYVKLTQDVMKVGGYPARVKSVSGNQITIDDAIETGPYSYGFTYRNPIDGIVTNTLTVVNSDTFDLDGSSFPSVGDLIVIGVVDQITFDCIVKSISPNDDLSATITLIEKADGILDAESSDTIPEYDPIISLSSDTEYAPPDEVRDLEVAANYWECAPDGYNYKIELDWEVPSGAAFDIFEIWVDDGRGYNLVDRTKDSQYTYLASDSRLGVEHSFKVLAVSAAGKKLELGQVTPVTATPEPKTAPPSDVGSLDIDITGEVLQLFWTQVTDCDVDEYLIRYSPLTVGATWEASVPLLRVDRNTTTSSTQARTGSYLIKAVDFNQNESVNAILAVTTIPELFGLNVIEEIGDFPTLPGNKFKVVASGNALMLQKAVVGGVETTEYYDEGFYTFENLLDLGEIYTVRLQAAVLAEGFTESDLMSNWTTLSDVLSLSNSEFSEWAVEAQYRTTESLQLMSAWTSLDDVAAMSSGDEDDWSTWRTFTMGDATGRLFQFRLRLISNAVDVTPRIIDAVIKADMPDRDDSYVDLTAPDTGLTVTYAPAFKGPAAGPSVKISINDMQSGDYWTFTNKDVEGFTIMFFDKNDVAISRTFDATVKGYGRRATAAI
jgi:Putative phage tail protein